MRIEAALNHLHLPIWKKDNNAQGFVTANFADLVEQMKIGGRTKQDMKIRLRNHVDSLERLKAGKSIRYSEAARIEEVINAQIDSGNYIAKSLSVKTKLFLQEFYERVLPILDEEASSPFATSDKKERVSTALHALYDVRRLSDCPLESVYVLSRWNVLKRFDQTLQTGIYERIKRMPIE